MILIKNLFAFLALLSLIACSDTTPTIDSYNASNSELSRVWLDDSVAATLYLLTPQQLESADEVPPPALARLEADTASADHIAFIETLVFFTPFQVPTPLCDLTGGQDVSYLLVESASGSTKRYVQDFQCNIGLGDGFFQAAVDGVVSNKQLCDFGMLFGVMGSVCADPDPTVTIGALEATIVNRNWKLEHYESSDGSVASFTNEMDFEFTLRFSSMDNPDGSIKRYATGMNVCNVYGGDYKLEEDTLILSNLSEDSRACERASESPASLFTQLMFSTDNPPILAVNANKLVVSTISNERLIFTVNDSVELAELRNGDLASLGNQTFSQPRYQSFNSQEALNDFYISLVQCPCLIDAVPQVNFNDTTILFVAQEISGSGGYSIDIIDFDVVSNRLTLEVIKTGPGESCVVTDALTGPYKFYSVDGVYDNIDFRETVVTTVYL